MSITNEQYIEHEVQLRVMDKRFKSVEESIQHIDNKLNWLVALIIGSILLPVALQFFKLI